MTDQVDRAEPVTDSPGPADVPDGVADHGVADHAMADHAAADHAAADHAAADHAAADHAAADHAAADDGVVGAVAQVARAVLYEGYMLWPYRASALKNSRRWTLGGVHPAACAATGDASTMRTQVLIEADSGDTVDVRVYFLHALTLDVGRLAGDELVPVRELTVAGRRHLAREEAVERRIVATGLDLAGLLRRPVVVNIDIPEGREVEWLAEPGGRCAGALTRGWRALRGQVEIRAERLPEGRRGELSQSGQSGQFGQFGQFGEHREHGESGEHGQSGEHGKPSKVSSSGLFRLTIEVRNTTEWGGGSRTEALRRTFASAHTILHSPGGRFVSLTDPPEGLRPYAQECDNTGTWPVLAGDEGDRHTVLSSPIILYDHPRIAPESPGDLFDATEIDQLLTLGVLCLTEEEQREIRDGDPRAREILDRCASLPPEHLMRLHGALREFRPLTGQGAGRE